MLLVFFPLLVVVVVFFNIICIYSKIHFQSLKKILCPQIFDSCMSKLVFYPLFGCFEVESSKVIVTGQPSLSIHEVWLQFLRSRLFGYRSLDQDWNLLQQCFRLAFHIRRMVGFLLLFISRAKDVLIFLVFPHDYICALRFSYCMKIKPVVVSIVFW